MRQQRTDRSQGWVKVLAVLQTEHTLRGKILPFRNCVKYKSSSSSSSTAAAYHLGSSDEHNKSERYPVQRRHLYTNDSTNPNISNG
jgi:hypothetical protein